MYKGISTKLVDCRGPDPTWSWGTLRMDGAGERERESEWHGETKLQWVRPITLFSKGAFIPWLVHRGKWRMQGHAESAQTLQQFWPCRNQDFFFCMSFHKQGSHVMYIIFWPGGLLTFYGSFLDKCWSTKKLVFPWSVFFFIPLICVSLRVY